MPKSARYSPESKKLRYRRRRCSNPSASPWKTLPPQSSSMTKLASSVSEYLGRFPPGVLTRRMVPGTISLVEIRNGMAEKVRVVRPFCRADRGGRMRSAAAVVFGLLLLSSGCATSPSADEADSDNDPAEGVNRTIFKANLAADHAVMRPVAQAYTDHVPEVVQTGIHNVVQNLKE